MKILFRKWAGLIILAILLGFDCLERFVFNHDDKWFFPAFCFLSGGIIVHYFRNLSDLKSKINNGMSEFKRMQTFDLLYQYASLTSPILEDISSIEWDNGDSVLTEAHKQRLAIIRDNYIKFMKFSKNDSSGFPDELRSLMKKV